MQARTPVQPFVVSPGDGDRSWSLNHLTTVKAAAARTNGVLGVIEVLVDKNGEPPPHVHHGEDESFYVLEGDVTMYVGDERSKRPPARSSSLRVTYRIASPSTPGRPVCW
ncbi:MAG: cupin domain-containing protein [Actinomycetota bacterium]|nr:cupin domain-containing protein [Actinomycetota bacterium]